MLDSVLPAHVPLKVVNTAPPVRAGYDANWKVAMLETGLQIMVPLFIATGEPIRLDTNTRKYVGRESLS